LGAAQQLWLLCRNQKEIRELRNFRRSGALEVPIGELVENKEQQKPQQLKKKNLSSVNNSHPQFRQQRAVPSRLRVN
jgi:hypothetical protein